MSNKPQEGDQLSRPFETACPHCGQPFTIPYRELSRHLHQEMGRISASKRKDFKEHIKTMNRQRWESYTHPKQEELLELAKTVDITSLPMTQIADKLGFEGPYRGVYVKRLITNLQKKGLLPERT